MRKVLLGILIACLLAVTVILGYISLSPYIFKTEKIVFESEYPSYTLQKTNHFKDFEKAVDELGFWGDNAVTSTSGSSKITAKNLTIVLTPDVKNGLPYRIIKNGSPVILSSFSYFAEVNDVKLSVYVNFPELNKEGLDANKELNLIILRSLYLLVRHDPINYNNLINQANQ